MPLTEAQLRLYQKGVPGLRAKPSDSDTRFGSTYERLNRSFIRVTYGSHTIVFYPLKEWPSTVGVSNPTLRAWIKSGTITAFVMHRMPVMNKAEMLALRKAVDQCGFHRKQVTFDAKFKPMAMTLLTEVRTSFDKLKRGMILSDHEYALILPSVKP